jgi:DUF4097 and DUF4098 domain-containing protein YvlB
MKMMFLFLFFAVLNGAAAYCGGLSEKNLVNTREIELEHITGIEILYRGENVIIRQGGTDKLVLKEYMSRDNPRYYANVSDTGGKITIERGDRPIGILINTFYARAEVFIPESYMGPVTVKTSSGDIEAVDGFVCAGISFESSSGNIKIDSVTAEAVNIKTRSGNIDAGTVQGDVSAVSSSGRVRFGQITGSLTATASSGNIRGELVNGSITAKTTSGNISCSAGENAGDISLASTSGNIALNIPEGTVLNFSSRTSSGRLSTPFPEKLFSPVSDRNLTQGRIGGDNPAKNIDIRTSSGSIKIDWIQGTSKNQPGY